MRLIVNQNFPAERVEHVKQDETKTGLCAGDSVVSTEIYEKIKEYLNTRAGKIANTG